MRADFFASLALNQRNAKISRQLDESGALQVCQDFYASLDNAPPADTVLFFKLYVVI